MNGFRKIHFPRSKRGFALTPSWQRILCIRFTPHFLSALFHPWGGVKAIIAVIFQEILSGDSCDAGQTLFPGEFPQRFKFNCKIKKLSRSMISRPPQGRPFLDIFSIFGHNASDLLIFIFSGRGTWIFL
jgi:hypothetical protein